MMQKVEWGSPHMVSDCYGYFPYATRLSNGTIFLQVFQGLDVVATPEELRVKSTETRTVRNADCFMEIQRAIPDKLAVTADTAYCWLRSLDGGESFHEYGLPEILSILELPDGRLVGLNRLAYVRDGGLCTKVWFSGDMGESWDGPVYVPLSCPPLIKRPAGYVELCFHRSLLFAGDGAILLLAYGKFDGDKKDRVMLFRTQDTFSSIHYYSTVACENENPGIKALDEGTMARLPDGRIICVMRNNGFLPMYQAWSHNDGATWSMAVSCGSDGVDPHLAVMDSGLVACSYGRPHVNVMFSRDGGTTWADRICFYETPHSRLGRADQGFSLRSCCYTSLLEIKRNELLLFYSAPVNPEDSSDVTPWNPMDLPRFRIYTVRISVMG